MTVGSVCSGIEAASVAWRNLGAEFKWFSEIAPFPSKFLAARYPQVPNLGDLTHLPERIATGEIPATDVICGGTPCQAFSVTGHQRGLADERGQLTLKFIEIIKANDVRRQDGRTIVFWENVEGVLSDKTNAFGCFIAALAGCNEALTAERWSNAGLVRGPVRDVAWRVLDAKFFGVPQQRRRLYVVAGGHDLHPERILFEEHGSARLGGFKDVPLQFTKNGKRFEVFRSYTDCLYSAYGTKWNGNAAAYNGSLYVAENNRLRRMTPLETERLMGFPDNYTAVPFARRTNRFQGTGNSWVVPVVRWIGQRIFNERERCRFDIREDSFMLQCHRSECQNTQIYLFNDDLVCFEGAKCLNVSATPERIIHSNIADVIDTEADESLFISPVGCKGILRRSEERGMHMNPRLRIVMEHVASQMAADEIERISRIQPRGAFSRACEAKSKPVKNLRRRTQSETSDDTLFEAILGEPGFRAS